jgi:hypothetical protein
VQSTAVATLYQGRSLTVTRAVLRRRLAQ